MKKSFVVITSVLGGFVPLSALDLSRLNFNIGGGLSTRLNPTAQYAGLRGKFATGAGYDFYEQNSMREFMWSCLPRLSDRGMEVLHGIAIPLLVQCLGPHDSDSSNLRVRCN
jgi:hypothetical protein